MSAPTIESIFPSNGSTGVPIGSEILITFDSEIDEFRAQRNIMIFGPDFDQTSGPDSLQWINPVTGYNPYFLQSPGFNGDVKGKFYFDLLDNQNAVISGFDYASGAPVYKTRVKFIPKTPLAPLTTYTVYVIGNPDNSDPERGIASRTVYSTSLGSNIGGGNCVFSGGYKGTINDTINIRITVAGNIRTAEYEWYLSSESSITYNMITSTKYRALNDLGVDVRFTGSDFRVGDTFSVNVYPPTFMTTSYQYTFTTGTGNIVEVPDNTSTSVLGDPVTVLTGEFEIVSHTPEHKEIKVDNNLRIIKITFTNDIDASTINDKTIKIVAHPATGYDANVTDVGKLRKFLLVHNNILYIILQGNE